MREQEVGALASARMKLAALPEFALDAALWPRVLTAYQRRRRIRNLLRVGVGGAIAAMLVVALVLMPRPVQRDATSNLVVWQRESQTLEREWQGMHHNTTGSVSARANMRLIDRALQAAYDRGATPEELAPLWRKRNAALRILIANRHDMTAVARI
ncbi:MAG: hypothetical protein WB784_09420 [Rhodanobacteraceae bacterium]